MGFLAMVIGGIFEKRHRISELYEGRKAELQPKDRKIV